MDKEALWICPACKNPQHCPWPSAINICRMCAQKKEYMGKNQSEIMKQLLNANPNGG